MRDQLPTAKFKPFHQYVINMDTTGNTGTHWVCCLAIPVTDNGNDIQIIWYDSYGHPPPVEMSRYTGKIIFNDTQFQHNESFMCGYFCLYIMRNVFNGLIQKKAGIQLAELVYDDMLTHLFTEDKYKNDQIVNDWYKGI
jgi:hypothetical protein